jgi:hypothetical protein
VVSVFTGSHTSNIEKINEDTWQIAYSSREECLAAPEIAVQRYSGAKMWYSGYEASPIPKSKLTSYIGRLLKF